LLIPMSSTSTLIKEGYSISCDYQLFSESLLYQLILFTATVFKMIEL
jgi:hypothetical protein